MLITQDTKNKHATSSWRRLGERWRRRLCDRGAGPGLVEERWQNTLRSIARSSNLVVKNRKKSNVGPSKSTSYDFLSQFDFTNFQILEAPVMITAPWEFFFLFSFVSFFPNSTNVFGCHQWTDDSIKWQKKNAMTKKMQRQKIKNKALILVYITSSDRSSDQLPGQTTRT